MGLYPRRDGRRWSFRCDFLDWHKGKIVRVGPYLYLRCRRCGRYVHPKWAPREGGR